MYRFSAQCFEAHVLQTISIYTGVYEGGFKLWEASEDLAAYLAELPTKWRGKRVLEVRSAIVLGRGVALGEG